ncbi:inositol monophosphatase family protein [Lacisediminihabitans changchengi]|uniref:Inositol monophosphatase n=1 Tax=Lacisediminihabitans changchengi TaxID=2787634 RepID=A0A934W2K8_9MICO|nr:inositol monophosphatase family protein [Lacisediminihabitans changchengi]MBK4346294.1 inositol monophosphatase [Lacisediminihabitans changchengi]
MTDRATIDEWAAAALELGRWAAEEMRNSEPLQLTAKANLADIVTDVDQRIESRVRDVLSRRFPSHTISGEEFGTTGGNAGSPTWYLDPIDGTTNFANGIPWSSFSLALEDGDGPLLGVVVDPSRGEIFTAERGNGARLNGLPVHCSPASSLAGTVVLTEWRGHLPWEGMYSVITELANDHATTRIMGSSALSLVTTGCGRSVATILGAYDPIDDMAGLLFAQEAGARIELVATGVGSLTVVAPGVSGAVAAARERATARDAAMS